MSATTQPAVTAEFAVAYRDFMLQALTQEVTITQRVLAAVPDGKRDYRPDPKSRTAWELAWHIACEDVILLEQMVEQKFSLPDPRYDGEKPATSAALAAWYQKKMLAALEKASKIPADQLLRPLAFFDLMKWPAFMYLALINNHSIHHRGQLSAYLRPMGAKVPSIYGGSADEPA